MVGLDYITCLCFEMVTVTDDDTWAIHLADRHEKLQIGRQPIILDKYNILYISINTGFDHLSNTWFSIWLTLGSIWALWSLLWKKNNNYKLNLNRWIPYLPEDGLSHGSPFVAMLGLLVTDKDWHLWGIYGAGAQMSWHLGPNWVNQMGSKCQSITKQNRVFLCFIVNV